MTDPAGNVQADNALLSLFPERYRPIVAQIGRFMLSTGFSAAMSFLLPILLHEVFGIAEHIAVAIGFSTAYIGNLLLLRLFVFRSGNDWKRDTFGYILVNGIFRLTEYGAFLTLSRFTDLSYIITLLLVLGTAAVIKFFAYRWLFRSR